MPTNESKTIKSAQRVLEILEYFDKNHTHVTVMDMARSLSCPQSSTSELLRCLTRLGYLHYNRYRRTYRPTVRVALLGSWVKPSLFRGGSLLDAIDGLSDHTEHTVLLSSAGNYVVQHLHVVHGEDPDAVAPRTGAVASLLHSAQGKLLLSSYTNEQVRLAVHRLNAEQNDPAAHVRIAEFLDELEQVRRSGWAIVHDSEGTSTIAVLLPVLRGMDRMTISLAAPTAVIEKNQSALLAAILQTRDEIVKSCEEEIPALASTSASVVPMNTNVKILSYRRHYV